MPANETGKKLWRIVEFTLESAHEDMASWLMMQQGATGCEIDVAGEGEVRLRATFEEERLANGDTTALSAAMEEYGLSASLSSLRVSDLHEEDWLAKWKVGFVPFTVGERLLVCPEWERDNLSPELKAGREVIYIEPGLAFGTGFHPTTRFCLGAVEKCITDAKRVLDVGTGSGILAIGAALLSEQTAGNQTAIIALETDPHPCKVARENFALNGVADRIVLYEGSTEKLLGDHEPAKTFDFVLSNLTYEDNAALLPDYMLLSHSGTNFAFAGILREKLELMRAALAKHDLQILEEEVGDMWAGLLARRS